MATTNTPAFPQKPKTFTAVVTAACVIGTADAPTNTTLLVTAGTDGAILTNLHAMPRATNTAASLLLFLSKDGGTTKRLIDSALMPAATVNTTTAIQKTQFARFNELTPMRLEAGDTLYVGSQVLLAAGFVFECEFTNY